MADGRMLKKNISNSRRLLELKTDSARLLWTWILPYLDIEGRFFADPELIKGHVVPRLKSFNLRNIAEYLADMSRVGLITLYSDDGEKYLQFRNFREFQNLRENREGKSKFPPPTPGGLQEDSRNTPAEVKLSKVNLSKVKRREEKERFLDFVFLSQDEYQKLITQFGEEKTKDKIEALNLGIGSKGYKFKSHYMTILNWDRMDREKNKPQESEIDKWIKQGSAPQ